MTVVYVSDRSGARRPPRSDEPPNGIRAFEEGLAIQGGYERLLLDVTHGDQTLFTRGDEVEHAWRVVTPILQAWEKRPAPEFPNYAAGTWGPEAADKFLERDGRRWRTL